MPPSPVSTARTLQQMLEAEGAIFHRDIAAKSMPSMGGGVGVVVTNPDGLRSGTVLATLPFRSMITTRKARWNLAMAEVAVAEVQRLSSTTTPAAPTAPGLTLPLTAHVWESDEMDALQAVWGTPLSRAVIAKDAELQTQLSPTDTIVCYLLLLANLYGRWAFRQGHGSVPPAVPSPPSPPSPPPPSSSSSPTAQKPVALHFTHENAWMRVWMWALPDQYDNLLELEPSRAAGHRMDDVGDDDEASPIRTTVAAPRTGTSAAYLTRYTPFARQVEKVRQEQRALHDRFTHCCSVLRCLTVPLIGVEAASTATSTTAATPCKVTPEHFRWAFNTLMSRGFAFEEDIWAMMPWVDYFNYALSANGTMTWQSTATAVTSRRGRHRTALNSLAQQSPNAYTYHFELIQPVRGGGQVFLHYGAYSDFELLQWYGFRLGGFLLPTTLMEKVVGTSPAPLVSVDSPSYLLNPLIHQARGDADSMRPHAEGQASDDEVRRFFTEALRRECVLSRFLPELMCAGTREGAFDVFWTAQEAQRRLDAASTCRGGEGEPVHENEEASDDGDSQEEMIARKELAYEAWCQATQRACSYALSPYADTDGNYPDTRRDGETWLHALLRLFLTSPTPSRVSEGPVATHAVHAHASSLDRWSRALASLVLDGSCTNDEELMSYTRKNCFLGPLGCSQQLAGALDRLNALLMKHPRCWDLLPAEAVKDPRWPRKAYLRRQLVRAIAWAELYVNSTGATAVTDPVSEAVRTMSSFWSCDSERAAEMTFAASCDAWTLLRTLALEAADAELDDYVAYEDAYYG